MFQELNKNRPTNPQKLFFDLRESALLPIILVEGVYVVKGEQTQRHLVFAKKAQQQLLKKAK